MLQKIGIGFCERVCAYRTCVLESASAPAKPSTVLDGNDFSAGLFDLRDFERKKKVIVRASI